MWSMCYGALVSHFINYHGCHGLIYYSNVLISQQLNFKIHNSVLNSMTK